MTRGKRGGKRAFALALQTLVNVFGGLSIQLRIEALHYAIYDLRLEQEARDKKREKA